MSSRRHSTLLRSMQLALLTLLLFCHAIQASEVKVVQQQSQSDFLEGDLDGISVDPLGTLRLANKVEKIVALEEPFVFSAARHPDGVVVGTGNEGRVLLISDDGTISELFKTEEPEVFAVLVDDDGSVLAGSSPNGKVYRWAAGEDEVTVLAEPGELYIWDLERDPNGDLLVATGANGKLFRVTAPGELEQVYDSDDQHLRTLLLLPNGKLLVGTAGKGLLLEIDATATAQKAQTLLDAAQPEIVALTLDDSGAIFVAALASEASMVDLSSPTPTKTTSTPSSNGDESDKSDDSAAGSVSVKEGSVAAGSRPSGFKGGRSEIYRVDGAGGVETVWRFEKETVFSLLWYGERLWVSTGLDGQLYSYQGERMVLESEVDDKQIVSLLPGDEGPLFVSTNAAAVYRVTGGSERKGSFTSKAIDAGQRARFGSLYWEGAIPRGTSVMLSARTGNASEPDETWSDWSEEVAAERPGQSLELSDLPPGRYAQWRVVLEAPEGKTPKIDLVELSYLQMNRRPEFESVKVLDPGEIVVQSNFNPANQAFEPASPNRDGIFTTLDATRTANEQKRFKTLWKEGYRTVQWKAQDPNEDQLLFSLAFRRVPDPREPEGEDWLTFAEDVKDPHYSFDSTVLPDGRYRFRVTASDQPNNPGDEALTASEISNVVVVDHSPPSLVDSRVTDGRIELEIKDSLSPLREAVYSVNAEPWRPTEVEGGLLDSRTETVIIDRKSLGATAIEVLLLRVTDAAHNVTTYDLSSLK